MEQHGQTLSAEHYGLINTRPLNRADDINLHLTKLNIPVLSLPLLAITKLAEAVQLPPQAVDKSIASTIIVLSPSAAEYGIQALAAHYNLAQIKQLPWRWVAVGQATQRALHSYGINSEVPALSNSEGVIALPAFLAAQHIWIWRGAGGRRLIDDTVLQDSQKKISQWTLYTRAQPPSLAQNWQSLQPLINPSSYAVLITSVESWQHYKAVAQTAVFAYNIVALGQRVANTIQQDKLSAGCLSQLEVDVVADLSPAQIVEGLQRLRLATKR